MTEKSVQAMDDETLVIQGNKILVRPYILPHISKLTSDEIKMLGGKDGLRKQQGFYVYRNKRLLVWGTWFRMMRQGDLSKLARIRVDIPNTLDDLWTLDIKKSSALPPAEVRKNLEIIINQIAERSKRTWTFRGKKEISDTETHVWNRMKNKQGGFYYEVNREHPLVQQMIKAHPDIEVSLNALLQQIEMGLPLNQLYVDLNNDEQITNDNEQSDVEIVKSLQEMITMCADKQEKCNLLDAIACIDPYSSHLDIVEKFKEEILKMINPNVEQLESLISAVVNNLYKEVPPTEDEFLEKATLLRNTNAPIMPVSDDEFAEIISRLKQSLVIQMDVGVYINDRNNGHQSWLPSKRADFDFFFWNRYKKYLEEIKHWNPRVTTNLGKVSDEILDLCGDPSEDHFAIKGLVLGDVQSGKTANYTAICNKAADTGYRIIIVLAGMQENLRKQTQERLDAECTGRKSEYYLDPKAEQGIKNQPVGVGRYGTDKKSLRLLL